MQSRMKSFLLMVFVALLLAVNGFDAGPGDKALNQAAKQEKYLKRTGMKYLDEIGKKAGIIKLKSGMLIEVLKESDAGDKAKSPTESDSCDVTYLGTFKDGSRFDGSRTSFAPNQVIKGWTEAMQLMVEGDKWKLYIPYDLAYGARGSPPRIPAFTPLVFEIEIHKVNGAGKSKALARKKLEESKDTTAKPTDL